MWQHDEGEKKESRINSTNIIQQTDMGSEFSKTKFLTLCRRDNKLFKNEMITIKQRQRKMMETEAKSPLCGSPSFLHVSPELCPAEQIEFKGRKRF